MHHPASSHTPGSLAAARSPNAVQGRTAPMAAARFSVVCCARDPHPPPLTRAGFSLRASGRRPPPLPHGSEGTWLAPGCVLAAPAARHFIFPLFPTWGGALDQAQIRRRRDRRRIAAAVVPGRRVGPVAALVADRRRVGDLGDAGRQRIAHRDSERGVACSSTCEPTDRECADAPCADRRSTRPAGRAGARVEAGVERHALGDHHTGRVLVALVGVGQGIRYRPTRCDTHAAV